MGYNYGMHDKTSQQKVIVKKSERTNELLRQNREKNNVITFKPKVRTGDFEAVEFKKDNEFILELRVSGTAIANEPCGLNRETIHEWLGKTGKSYAKQISSPEVILITSKDIIDEELITDWKNLNRQ